ncbi:KR-domain-containing protein [Aspergillus vadensis CBS 113365]|uniref:KR-domain-containing protein n=1 Tax=Aspergillus vadensis (strain CBS 113365 / IMI 142717 / IBT 24658) TaxID=1448311 RepID=A0A319AWX0_ASPVC|nr:KR-domain-containing protein [Aspergillus vadensis CBS 113365]PYH64235.1 KR-domain-containing protein [Aspergillus vadensis CBS 113365]
MDQRLSGRWSCGAHSELPGLLGPELNQPEFCQPICTALQIALVELLADWNFHPFAAVGHLSGEVAAAYCAGIITKSRALELALFRGLAVSATSRIELLADLANSQNPETRNIGIACYISPQNLTLSRATNQIERLALALETEEIMSKRSNVSIAYHNAKYMESAASLYQALIKKSHSSEPGGRANSTPSCYMFSSVRDIIFAPDSDASEVSKPDYWLDNLVCPVRFTQAMQKLASLLENKVEIANTHFIEVGPHSTLKSAIKENLAIKFKGWSVERMYSHMLSRQKSAVSTALTVAGRLYSLGLPLDLIAANNQHSNSNRVLIDLPSYPFNHSKRYWMGSRISKDHRNSNHPHHDFLGKSASDWNPLEPQWNNKIILQDQPWIRDYQVSGACVYPAAGMLAMAIEATRQVVYVPNHQPICYQFRDVVFSRSVVVPDSRLGVEVQFRLRKVEQLSMDLAPCYDFRLYMHDHGGWAQCCRGYIAIEHHTSLCDFDLDRSAADEQLKRLSASLSPAQHQKFFARLRDSGLSYGPIFQMDRENMHGVENEGVGKIDLQRWTDLIEENNQSPCFIHPAALDCIIQVAFLGITRGGQVEIPTIVPTAVNHLWISANITQQMVAVSAKPIQSNERPLLMGDLTLTSIEKTATPAANETKESIVSMYRVEWKPDVNLLGPQSGLFAAQPLQLSQSELERIKFTEYACFLAMSEVLHPVDGGVSVHYQSPKHLQKYLAWMRHQSGLISASVDWRDWISTQPAGSGFQEQLWQRVSSFGPEGRLIVRLCRQLLPINQGEVDVLQILFADETLADYYRLENPPPEVVKGVQQYVDCMAHANPNMRVLEIGAGTGGMTQYILDVIGGHNGSAVERFAQYVFTDISPTIFKDAREKLGKGERIVRKTLDIEKTPADQGFEVEAFDLVIASNISSHSAYRQLLKPRGKLILVEGTSPNLLRTSFIFGCLLGWWLSTESYREWRPLVSVDRWDKLLHDSQFTGADFLLDGPDKANSLSSAVISTARPLIRFNSDMPTSSDILVVRKESSDLQQSLATAICDSLQESELSVSIHDASELHEVLNGATVVLLQTIDDFVFQELDEKGYDSQKPGSLEQDAVLGLARSLMSEIEGLNIVTLGSEDIETTSRAAQHIRAVLQHYFCADTSLLSIDGEEIFEIYGRLCLSRPGDSIIIHDGASSLSQAAIQLAQFLGAEVFVTFNTRDEEAIADMYSIPASHRFPQQGHMLMTGNKRLTHDRGADVMFTPSIARESDQAAWNCLKEYGRVIEVVDKNARSSFGAMPPRPQLFKQSVMFARLDIPTLLQDTEKIATILPEVMRLIEHKSVVPVQPLRVLTLSELEKSGGVKAVEHSRSAKTCISFDLNNLTASKPQLFDSTATYLIAGGLGGLGRSIAKWMISNGARYLVLLSRQGTESPGADTFLDECATMSVTTFAPKCDISDERAFSEVIQEVQRRMPPIKGCIQASMVLKSAMFAKMTLDQWNEALRSKVQGSYNLDRHLPTPLDFFIFLSSVCGIIGASGQSNYAFGCAYQDALARSKVAMRQKAISIDLGIVEGVGYTAEHQGVGSFMRSLGLQPIPEEYLLSILEYYCDSKREICHPSDAQLVVGIMNQDEMQRSGLVRSRFYSRPLWNHLQRRMNPTLGRSKVVAAQRSNEKGPSSLKLPIAASDDTLSSTVADGGPDAVSRAICERVSDVLAINADDIDPAKPLHMYGVDSLVAMELRSWFKEALQKDVAVFDILSNRPIEVLAQEVVGVAAAA